VRKPLPKSYLPLAVFRQRHGISEKAIEVALDKKRLAVRRGRWTYEHRAITLALDRQGQQQFYDLFHAHASFQSCERCPHAV
jgi:hypothetical protein